MVYLGQETIEVNFFVKKCFLIYYSRLHMKRQLEQAVLLAFPLTNVAVLVVKCTCMPTVTKYSYVRILLIY